MRYVNLKLELDLLHLLQSIRVTFDWEMLSSQLLTSLNRSVIKQIWGAFSFFSAFIQAWPRISLIQVIVLKRIWFFCIKWKLTRNKWQKVFFDPNKSFVQQFPVHLVLWYSPWLGAGKVGGLKKGRNNNINRSKQKVCTALMSCSGEKGTLSTVFFSLSQCYFYSRRGWT